MDHADLNSFDKRRYPGEVERVGDKRTQADRDRARILHSAAFRRLQGKTQVMGVAEGDFHRTRLTHSIECAQIGNGLLEHLPWPDEIKDWKPRRDLVEAACFAHDLGHPPFGHAGEIALHRCMKLQGGFEGNAQTLRLLTRLERHNIPDQGLNPTRRLLLAILKYPVSMSAVSSKSTCSEQHKCYYDEDRDVVEWALEKFTPEDRSNFISLKQNKSTYKTLDCSLMELADDIAYGVHDIEDIIARRLIPEGEMKEALKAALEPVKFANTEGLNDKLTGSAYQRKTAVGWLVNHFITSARIEPVANFAHPLLRYRVELPAQEKNALKALKTLTKERLIEQPCIQHISYKGDKIVSDVFDALSSYPSRLVPGWGDINTDVLPARRICDYISSLSNREIERLYRRLFVPGYGSM